MTHFDRIARGLILLYVLVASCGGELSLWVRLPEWPAEATALSVVPWLNGVKQSEITVPSESPGFVVALPVGVTGEIRLQIDALDKDGCRVGTAEVKEALGLALRATREKAAQIVMLPEPICTLSLELPKDLSIAADSSPGLMCSAVQVCGMRSVRCEAEAPKASMINFKLEFDPHQYAKVDVTGANCTEEGSCYIAMNQRQNIHGELTVRECSPDGFCVYKPTKQENALRSVWGTDANNVWAVGTAGTILKWNGRVWSLQLSNTSNTLYGVWGTDPSNVWAIGSSGTILQWDGREWKITTVGTDSLYGVWGTSASNVWAVGANGTILHWDGAIWTSGTSGTEDLHSVWGSDANNVWAVGNHGTTITKGSGDTWTEKSSFGQQDIVSVWGSDANHVWATTTPGYIFRWELGEWKSQYSSGSGTYSDTLYGVWTIDAGSAWAVGKGGVILNFDGINWSAMKSGITNKYLFSVWGNSASDIWVVGAAGTMLRRRL